jgi:alpha-tubulin suppressor-like RCC1 family protein
MFVFGLAHPAAAVHAATVAVGAGQGCATKQDGSVWCWGDNSFNEAGVGAVAPYVVSTPVAVAPFNAGAVGVGASYGFSLAVKADGSVWGWGADSQFQLGISPSPITVFPPAQVPIGPTVVGIAGGYLHACAVRADHSVWCWGGNFQGQTGQSAGTLNEVPQRVTLLPGDAAQITAGDRHTCAAMTDNTAWCWGYDVNGQLGDGLFRAVSAAEPTPEPVTALGQTVAQISGGFEATCALRLDGSAWCWGYNANGQLGDGTTNNNATPVPVSGLGSGVAQVSAGNDFACAVKTDGTVWCWGSNQEGQLGNGTTTDSPIPVRVGISNVVEVTTPNITGAFACARKSDRSVWCWGEDISGQLGDADPNSTGSASQMLIKPSPVQVAGFGPTAPAAVPATPSATAGLFALLLLATATLALGRRRPR